MMQTRRLPLLSFFAMLSLFCLISSAAGEDEIYDPIEPVNRGIFWFNEQFDEYLLEPATDVYEAVAPVCLRDKVSNVFENLKFPVYLLSDLVQLKFSQAGEHTARFLINSTLGVLGIFDVADRLGLKRHEEDFGVALAYHGVPAGPYLVLPFLGPSTLRDAVGTAVDIGVHPVTVFAYSEACGAGATDKVSYGSTGVRSLQTRSELDEAIESAREASVDYYLFMQSSYYQYRNGVIHDKSTKAQSDDEIFDDEDYMEEE